MCRELGISFVAYSPLGRGFLTGSFKSIEDLAPDDWRRNNPRFQGENFARNLELVRRAGEIAAEKGVKPSQLVLAWILAQGEEVVPIPGTRIRAHLEENVEALRITFSSDDLKRLNDAAPKGSTAGERYSEGGMKVVGL